MNYTSENIDKVAKAAEHFAKVAAEFLPEYPEAIGEHLDALIIAVDNLGDDAKILSAINVLRCFEGSSVNILCDNPAGPPNNAIEVCDELLFKVG